MLAPFLEHCAQFASYFGVVYARQLAALVPREHSFVKSLSGVHRASLDCWTVPP